MIDENEILTITELSDYLKIADRTIYGWAQEGVIPAYKMAGSWRFRRGDIDTWLESTRTGPKLVSDPRIATSPPVGPSEASLESKQQRESTIDECIAGIQQALEDRSRSAWAISRFSTFENGIVHEAIRRLKNRKLINTKTINGELTITRR